MGLMEQMDSYIRRRAQGERVSKVEGIGLVIAAVGSIIMGLVALAIIVGLFWFFWSMVD